MLRRSFFIRLFGDYPMVRVLDFLLEHREFDYPMTEIAENAGVGWSTLHELWPGLVRLGVVKETRRIGRARLFKLNTESPFARELVHLDSRLTAAMAEKLAREEHTLVRA